MEILKALKGTIRLKADAPLIAVGLVLVFVVSVHGQSKQQDGHPGRLFPPSDLGLLDAPDRDLWQRPDQIMDALGVADASVVADIGAGTGYFSWRLAKEVGPSGRVYAVDIQQEMLDLLAQKMAERKVTNVVPVLGNITDPRLPANAVDCAIMVDVYHEFSHPFEMMQSICRSLKPGGRVVFVEFRLEDPEVPIKLVHKMSEAQVRKEASMHPLEWVETLPALPRQHIIIFRKK